MFQQQPGRLDNLLARNSLLSGHDCQTVQRRISPTIAHIDLGPTSQQQPDGIGIAHFGCQMQSRTIMEIIVAIVERHLGIGRPYLGCSSIAVVEFINVVDCHGRFVQ